MLYDGEEVSAWRILEEDAPEMGLADDMLRRVAADPVSQAVFTDMMMRLFLKHVLGVRLEDDRLYGDGVAASGRVGLFGDVMAYFNELRAQKESQQSLMRQTNLGYTQSQGNVINAYSGGLTQGMSTNGGGLQRQGFDAAISFNQTMQN